MFTIVSAVIYLISALFFITLFWWRMSSKLSALPLFNRISWWIAYGGLFVAIWVIYLLMPSGNGATQLIFGIAVGIAIFLGAVSFWDDIVPWWKAKIRRKKG